MFFKLSEMYAAVRERGGREESVCHAGADDLRLEVSKRILHPGQINLFIHNQRLNSGYIN